MFVFSLSMLITTVDSMEVEIFLDNGLVPFVLFVKDARVVVHDHIPFHLNSNFKSIPFC